MVLKPQPFALQLADLVLIQLSNWRWSWRSMIITGTVAPVLSTIALGTFARQGQGGPGDLLTLGYILTGNLVLSLMFETLGKVCNNFAFMRWRGMLHYFAALPIHRVSLIVASLLAFLLLALPSVLVTLVFGMLYLRIPLHPHPLLALAIPLAALPLAGIGALIGVSARTLEEAGSLSLLLTLVLVGLGPVMIPPERLPGFMLFLGRFSPATYAASALRQVLLGPVTPRLWLDLGVLAALGIAITWLTGLKMDWRGME